MVRSLLLPASLALLFMLPGCTTFRAIPSTSATPGQVVRLQSPSPIVFTIPDAGGGTRACRVPNVRGLLFHRMDDALQLTSFRVDDAPRDTPRECRRGQLADVQLTANDSVRLEERRASLKRTLGLGLGIYVGFGLLIAAFLVPM